MSFDFCSAIADRTVIAFTYDDLPRVACPAAYGNHVNTGTLSLRAFQTGGSSSRGALPAWRLFTIDKMQDVEVQDKTFADPPPGYEPNDKHLDIICQL